MKSETHRKVSPVATAGIAYILLTNQMAVPLLGSDPVLNSLVLGGLGFVSANWPDADKHAMSLPMKAILGRCKRNADGKQVGVKKVIENGVVKRKKVVYYDIKRPDMRAMAVIFKALGVNKHRGFLTHSPILHAFILYMVYNALLVIPSVGLPISFIALGVGLGYLTHLLADLPTDGGLPLLPRIKAFEKIPILSSVFGDFRPMSKLKFGKHKFFLADNQMWNQMFFLIVLDVVGCIIFPDLVVPINKAMWGFIVSTFKTLI